MTPASVGFQCPECIREGRATVRTHRRGSGLQAAGRRWGAVTLSLIAINVVMFVVTAVSAGLAGNSPLDNYPAAVFVDLSHGPPLGENRPWGGAVTAALPPHRTPPPG